MFEYDSVKGNDKEFDRKFPCYEKGFCDGPGVAASYQTTNPNNKKECFTSGVPTSYCVQCTHETFRLEPDSAQPDIHKCKQEE